MESYFHSPDVLTQSAFITVLRAGDLKAAPDYRVERSVSPGHDLLLCISGRGYIRIHGTEFPVGPGQLGWIDGAHPHTHWAEPSDPWELLWLRLDGGPLSAIASLLRAAENPVFEFHRPREAQRTVRRILGRFRLPEPPSDAVLNVDVADLVKHIFLSRHGVSQSRRPWQAETTPVVARALEQMAVYYHRAWSIGDLARLSGLSVPQFFRRFHAATGLTPMQWLRRQRMSHAQRRLIESNDSVKEIAEQVGYLDPFHFSRDFKRWTGLAPSHFREREGVRPRSV